MDVDVRPDPPTGERQALLRALATLRRHDEARRSEWWRRGVAENVQAVESGRRP